MLKPATDFQFEVVGQRHIYSCRSPRRRLADDNTVRELVEREHVDPLLVVPQKENEVGQQRKDGAFLVEDQIASPVEGGGR